MKQWQICGAGLFGVVLWTLASAAQGSGGFTLSAEYDRPGLPVPHWELQIGPDGQATYKARHEDGGTVDVRTFAFSAGGLARLQTALDEAHGMQPCETKTKGIARMGQKTIVYRPAGGEPQQCSYNYTDNKGLNAATEYLQATALTLDDGARLEHLHRFDRLGLDPVMQQLGEFANQGKAVELGSIRDELHSLASDPQVLERVRTRAAQLLHMAERENAGLRTR